MRPLAIGLIIAGVTLVLVGAAAFVLPVLSSTPAEVPPLATRPPPSFSFEVWILTVAGAVSVVSGLFVRLLTGNRN